MQEFLIFTAPVHIVLMSLEVLRVLQRLEVEFHGGWSGIGGGLDLRNCGAPAILLMGLGSLVDLVQFLENRSRVLRNW